MDINDFIHERNAAFLSLEKEQILNYCKKYDVSIPDDELVFWAGVHKARLQIDIPETEKNISRQWLKDNGFNQSIG